MTQETERDRLLQRKWREEIMPNIGNEPWIRVYQRDKLGESLRTDIGSVFVPNDRVSTLLESFEWCTCVDSTGPSYSYTRGEEPGDTGYAYFRFGNDTGIEPLILRRTYDMLRPQTIEILEEFRLFHNLYFDSANNKYMRHDDAGDEIDVVRVHGNSVDVKRKELRRFLTARSMSLVIHVDRKYFSPTTIDCLDEQERQSEYRSEELIYQFGAVSYGGISDNSRRTYSWLLAKKTIAGLPPEHSGLWPFDVTPKAEFEDFIIGLNEYDVPVYFTSDPDQLADYHGKNRGAPISLTRIFFRREVLRKYHNEPSKYNVEDGALRCGGTWLLRMDNNHRDYVIVFLVDLGRELPAKEQAHWKSYNVPPDGRMSDTSFRRSFLGEFAEPEDCAILFKNAYERLTDGWQRHYNWHIFMELSTEDSHHFTTLRRLTTRESSELDEIVLSLSKLLVDSINIKDLRINVPNFKSKDSNGNQKRGISILSEYLSVTDYDDSADHIEYLRNVQALRSSSAAHRKGKTYERVASFFELDTKSTVQVADEIFATLTGFLDSLRAHFCPDEAS